MGGKSYIIMPFNDLPRKKKSVEKEEVGGVGSL